MDKRRTQTNGADVKKVDDDVQGLISEKWHKQTMYV